MEPPEGLGTAAQQLAAYGWLSVVLAFGNGFQTFVFWLAVVGLLVIGLLAITSGLAALFNREQRKGLGLTSVVMTALAAGIGSAVVERLGRFDTLTIQADNAWVAENLWGGDVVQLTADDMRAVDFKSRLVEGEPMTWIEIELPDGRRFKSLEARQSTQSEAISALRAHIGAHR